MDHEQQRRTIKLLNKTLSDMMVREAHWIKDKENHERERERWGKEKEELKEAHERERQEWTNQRERFDQERQEWTSEKQGFMVQIATKDEMLVKMLNRMTLVE